MPTNATLISRQSSSINSVPNIAGKSPSMGFKACTPTGCIGVGIFDTDGYTPLTKAMQSSMLGGLEYQCAWSGSNVILVPVCGGALPPVAQAPKEPS